LSIDDHLYEILKAAHARWSPDTLDRFPPKSRWEPPTGAVGTEIPSRDQPLAPRVPTVPTVPTEIETPPPRSAGDAHGDWEERAAILEFEGGLPRAAAEARATAEAWDYPSPD
jgi:hypothetical protein